MESRSSISNNIEFIQARSENAADLRAVIITRTHTNIQKAVSNDHILAVALAVDDEIAHLERTAVFNTDLLELYRIRYECAHRIAAYLLEETGIANTPYGKALRGYVYIHTSPQEQSNLQAHNIEPVSIPEVTSDVIANMGNMAYQAFLYYALEYFKTDSQDGQSRRLQEQRYANLVSQVKQKHHIDPLHQLISFTIFGGNPVDAEHAAAMYEENVRATPEIADINPEQLRSDIKPSEMLSQLYLENGELLRKTLSVFTNPGQFISSEDLKTKADLAEKLSQDNADIKMVDLKKGVVVMRYHHDLTNFENEMNNPKLFNHPSLAEWQASWKKINKYAHTAPEFLPKFIEKLEMLNQMVAALHHAVLYCREDSTQNKATYFLELLNTKEAIQREQILVVDSMLARLELLNDNTDKKLLDIFVNSKAEETFYANLIHHAYQQFMTMQGKVVEIDTRFKREELTTHHIQSFVALIMSKGTPEQLARLDAILPNAQANVLHPFSLVTDYAHPEPVRPPEFEIDMIGGRINIDDIAAPDYVSEANKEMGPVNISVVSSKIKEIRGIASNLDLVGLNENAITENQLSIFELFDSNSIPKDALYGKFCILKEVSTQDQILFAKLYIEKYGRNQNRINAKLLVEIIYQQEFMNNHFNHHLQDFIDDFIQVSSARELSNFQSYVDYLAPVSSSSLEEESVAEDDKLLIPAPPLPEEAPVAMKLNLFQRHPWIKYAAIGFAIAAVVALAIFVSLSTFGAGAVPGLLAVGGTIGLALGASAGSAVTVGLAVLGTIITIGAGLIGGVIARAFSARKARFKLINIVESEQNNRTHIQPVSQKSSPVTGRRPAGIVLFPSPLQDTQYDPAPNSAQRANNSFGTNRKKTK